MHALSSRTLLLLSLLSISYFFLSSCETTSSEENVSTGYEMVKNDPMNARIYTLDNGLQVYLSVNTEAPRVQTAIAVRAGSKNDPADATGLAHYLEHMLFKGTDKYGTSNFEAEEPLLLQIDSLYEAYRQLTDESERTALYAVIDSISQEASKYAIANEYDKLVSEMGAKRTNAYTSQERTVYINDIPTNQLEKWLTVEAERFRNPQIRLFHTELEAVYEEKNRALDSDGRKSFEAMMDGIFPNHQYGQQTTIGTIDHLKNPSIKEIKKYYKNYYVPNNMAICLSGDFDPDVVIEMIKEKFGGMPSSAVPDFMVYEEAPINTIIKREVWGPDFENLRMAFRFNGVGSKDADLIELVDMLLANSTAGLMDLNLVQKQAVQGASSFSYVLSDYSLHSFYGRAKEGQSLEEVERLILDQIDSLKQGNFPDWLLEACVNDLKKSEIESMDENRGRNSRMINAFIQRIPWEHEVNKINRLRQYTKEDIIQFVNEKYKNNYVVVYKRTGEDPNSVKVVKPQITPVQVNRDTASDFIKAIQAMETQDIEPRFLNYNEDIQESQLSNGLTVRSVLNENNDLFNLYYVIEKGTNHDPKLGLAIRYLPYLGTTKYSPSEIQQEFYKIGCKFNVFSGDERVYVSLDGLKENFVEGIRLFEHLLADAQADEEALASLIKKQIKDRSDLKLNKFMVSYALRTYGKFGPSSSLTSVLSKEELNSIQAEELISRIHELTNYDHRILYYGPNDQTELIEILDKEHQTPSEFIPVPSPKQFEELNIEESKVYVVDYDMKQAEIYLLSKDKLYDPSLVALSAIYNEYFGAGMGSIVFQELRESKALAYSVYSSFRTPSDSTKAHYVIGYIGAQSDKLEDAVDGLTELLEEMPEAPKNFELAKQAALEKIRTERITKFNKVWNYESALRRGVDHDLRKDVYEAIPNMTFADLKAFHEEHVKGKKYHFMVLGKTENLDMQALAKYGPVKQLQLEEIFGY